MKRLICFIAALMMILSLSIPCFAEELQFVIDDADLLTEYEENMLLNEIVTLRNTHSIDIVIHTTLDTDGKDIASYCDDYYDNGGYSSDGLIFVISMAERDYCATTSGTLVDTLPVSTNDTLLEPVIPYLSSGDYYSAFELYLKQLDSYLSGDWYVSDIPDENYGDNYYSDDNYIYYGDDYYYDSYTPEKPSYLVSEIILIVIAAAIAFLITTMIKRQMNTAVKKSDADDYVVGGSFRLDGSRDVFIGSHVSRRAIPKNNNHHGGSRPGGSGGVRMSSGGVRHGSSHGKF